MRNKKTGELSIKGNSTSGLDFSTTFDANAEKYVSKKSEEYTTFLYSEHRYVTLDNSTRVSTVSSRSREKLEEINRRLRKIAR